MNAVVSPYDLRLSNGVYSMVSQLILISNDENFYHTVYATSTTFSPLLPTWKSRVTTAVEAWAEDNEVTIDELMFLPDFSLLGL